MVIRDDERVRAIAAQIIEGIGAALILFGIACWSVPAALILGGIALLAVAAGTDHA